MARFILSTYRPNFFLGSGSNEPGREFVLLDAIGE